MHIERDVIGGDYRPASDVRVGGLVTGALIVIAGVSVELHGRVQPRSRAVEEARRTAKEWSCGSR
jgi:hypothetical protein